MASDTDDLGLDPNRPYQSSNVDDQYVVPGSSSDSQGTSISDVFQIRGDEQQVLAAGAPPHLVYEYYDLIRKLKALDVSGQATGWQLTGNDPEIQRLAELVSAINVYVPTNESRWSGFHRAADRLAKIAVIGIISAAGGYLISGGAASAAAATEVGTEAYAAAIEAGATVAEAEAAAAAAIDAVASLPTAAPGLFDVIGQGALRGGVSGALSSAMQGGNPLLGAAQGALTGGVTEGSTYAGNELWNQISSSGLLGQDVAPETFSPMMAGPLASPESVEGYLSAVPEAVPGMTLPVGGVDLDITEPGALEAAAAANSLIAPQEPLSDAPVSPEVVAPTQTPAQTAIDYAKTAKKVYSLYQQLTGTGADVQEFEIPEREEGQSDEEYLAAVGNAAVEYMSLDPDAMREAGLVPGTDEYLDYILEQADAIIAGIFGADPSALLAGESVEDLQAVLRDLTKNEATQLAQAMYVRGAFNQLSAQVSASDPFTDREEELGLLPGEMVNPNVAAQQRGYARALENIAELSGPGTREALTGLFGRDADLFGLQSAADTRAEAARKAEQEMEDDETDTDLVDEYGNLRKRRRKPRK